MTLNQFIEKYNGRYVEIAGSIDARNQCVDVVNAYIREVLGFPIIEWTNAVDFPSKANGLYDWIANTPTNVPQEGDIVVWGGAIGHIAVFIEGNASSFRSFDQNYPLGSPCHVQGHGYSNVLGWMRAKAAPVVTYTITDQTRIPQINNEEVQAIRSQINDLKRDYKGMLVQAEDLARQLNDALAQIKEKDKIIDDLSTDNGELRAKLNIRQPAPSTAPTPLPLADTLLKLLEYFKRGLGR